MSKNFSVWVIADLHLSFGVANKEMDVFGEEWKGWTEKIANNWMANISTEDLILIPGDISWAMHLEDALPDLEWLDSLPGTKVIIRGNHDYWWSSRTKIEKALPPSVHIIQNDAFQWKNVSIAGARLWDTPEFNFGDYIIVKESERSKELTEYEGNLENTEKIFQRELGRLELSLKEVNVDADHRIAMTHYPPIGADLEESRVSSLLEKYNIDICVFGHLHSLKPGSLPFGEKNGVTYHLTSCDYLNFMPLKII
ncbi:MAG: hypothetical protein K940chlam7_00187 [Chlamydiae bacterium]|nr:hypothetical protein [Chlamydiota bacterium]